MLINLNHVNGAAPELLGLAETIRNQFKKDIIGCEMGIAYGGGVEGIGLLWKGVGVIHGFDTFEGHPDYLAEKDPTLPDGKQSFAARCMDHWYNENVHGTKGLAYDYQRAELDRQGLDNVILHKGVIGPDTDVSFMPYLNYVFLDLDLPICMKDAYNLIKDKILVGGYLCLHDVVPDTHIKPLYDWYVNEVKKDGYEVVKELKGSMLVVLRKI